MHTNTDADRLKQLDELLATTNQSWLFGAGISVDAGIPLMWPLTERVLELARIAGEPNDQPMIEALMRELPDDCHIEHILSQLADHRSLTERGRAKVTKIADITLELDDLDSLHERILDWIATTIRWGYRGKSDDSDAVVGTSESPIVKVDLHSGFVSALFNRNQAGVAERRRPVKLFTVNYDTLLEDALALGCFAYWDGFGGGAVAYRSHRYGEGDPGEGYRAQLVKLHGSIDWRQDKSGRVWRVRDGDRYLQNSGRVLIYPQSIEYLATQRDPFAAQFELFRRSLSSSEENVLAICGYSFGDEHINQEIELALGRADNKTTILAFSHNVNDALKQWQSASWGNRLHVIAADGLHIGGQKEVLFPDANLGHDWWKFDGVTRMLDSGAGACI